MLKKRRAYFAATAVLATVVLLVSACGGSSDPDGGADSGSPGASDAGDGSETSQAGADGESAPEGDGSDVLSGELTVAVYGGPTAKTWQDAYGKVFSDKYPSVDLTISGVGNPASLLHTQQGDVQYDLILATSTNVAQLAQGDGSLYDGIDPSELQRADSVRDTLIVANSGGEWVGTPIALTYYGIVVRNDLLPDSGSMSWADIKDPRFEGKYLMNSPPYFATVDLPMFALANGGSPTELEPGFALLKETLPNVQSIAGSLASAASSMTSGEAGIAGFYFSQYSQLLDSDVPVTMVTPKEGFWAGGLYLVLSPNSDNVDAALAFLDVALGTDAQSVVQDPSAYIPTVKDVPLTSKLKARSGYDSVSDLYEDMVFVDYAYLAKNREANTKRIEDMIATTG